MREKPRELTRRSRAAAAVFGLAALAVASVLAACASPPEVEPEAAAQPEAVAESPPPGSEADAPESTPPTEATPAGGPDACALLTSEKVAEVQGRLVVEELRSTQDGTTIEVHQCVYRTEDLTSSVSLTLTVSRAGVDGGARSYWTSRFHPEGGHQGKVDPPRRIPDLGDDAFWTSDPVAGSLYVLDGDRFLRVSVGGVQDQEVRLERATRLAQLALGR